MSEEISHGQRRSINKSYDDDDDETENEIFVEETSYRSSRLVPFVRFDSIDECVRRIHTSSSARRCWRR